jgi:hypothetical protein
MLRVRAAGDVTARFVEEEVTPAARRLDPAGVDPDVVALGIRLRPELGDRLRVDRHPALRDQRFRGPAGGDAGRRQDFLQADLGHINSRRDSPRPT